MKMRAKIRTSVELHVIILFYAGIYAYGSVRPAEGGLMVK